MKLIQINTTLDFNLYVSVFQFIVGNMVLIQYKFTNFETRNKLSTKCDASYKIIEIATLRAYYFENLEGMNLPCPLDLEHLNIFHA